MAISKELQQKLDYYEQLYYGLDEPVPIKGDLKSYPVAVRDYYRFYNCFNCISMDKTVKMGVDNMGRPIKVSNPKGIGQSYLEYLVDQMREPEKGAVLTAQLMDLLELVFKIPKGMYCPHCGKMISYGDTFKGMEDYVNQKMAEVQEKYEEALQAQEESSRNKIEDHQLPAELLEKVKNTARHNYFVEASKCPDCQETIRDIFSIKEQNGIFSLVIKDTELNSAEFDELKAIIPRQNILDYDGDKYMDADLKEELDLKAQLQNKDYTSPTLEKQIVCVGIATGYTLEYLKSIPMRKLSMMLRLVDKEKTYYAQLQASMSGFVTFKEDPKHWIFSDDKRNIKDELTSLENFEKKFDQVT